MKYKYHIHLYIYKIYLFIIKELELELIHFVDVNVLLLSLMGGIFDYRLPPEGFLELVGFSILLGVYDCFFNFRFSSNVSPNGLHGICRNGRILGSIYGSYVRHTTTN